MAMIIDELFIFGGILAAAIGYGGLVIIYSDLQKWVPEWRTFMHARKKNLPILALTTPGSGESYWVLGEKDDKGDPTFDTKQQFGIQVDPNFSGQVIPERYKGGLKVYHFATTLPFAIDARHTTAIATAIATARQNEILDFLTDDELMSLLNTDRDDLDEYCSIFIEMYNPEYNECPLAAAELINSVIATQDKLARTAIKSGWNSYAFAFKNIATAYLSQDLHQYGLLIERKVRRNMEDWSKKMAFISIIGFAALLVLIGAAVAYTMISQ